MTKVIGAVALAGLASLLAGADAAAGTRYHEIRDPGNGMVQAISPIPADWQVVEQQNAPVYMTGPGGITVYRTRTDQFAWSPDPYVQQSILQTNQRLSAPVALEQILHQHVVPSSRAQGNRLVRSYPIPEVEGLWARFGAGMVQTGSRRQWRALGSDWTDDRGTSTFVSLVQAVSEQPQMVVWTLQSTSLEAPDAAFEEAKAAYLYAVGNTRINPRWQQYMNGQLQGQIRANEAFSQQMMESSRAAHQQRMAAIEAQGNAARTVGQTYSDILDINHAGYLKRDSINSTGHTSTINTIGERALIGNHETGEHYNVEDGSKYYWVGSDGTYFGTDNPLYDPMTDNRVNDVQWTKFVREQ